MTGTQWFIIWCLIVACWGGNKMFTTYLDKRFDLERMKAHEITLQKQVDLFERLLK
jgi:hypothetical protein